MKMRAQTESLLVQETSEEALQEELNALVETTLRLEHELELVIRMRDL